MKYWEQLEVIESYRADVRTLDLKLKDTSADYSWILKGAAVRELCTWFEKDGPEAISSLQMTWAWQRRWAGIPEQKTLPSYSSDQICTAKQLCTGCECRIVHYSKSTVMSWKIEKLSVYSSIPKRIIFKIVSARDKLSGMVDPWNCYIHIYGTI